MRRILRLLPLLILLAVAPRLVADPLDPVPADTARITGIGGLVIFTASPDSLAAWYAGKFGLQTPIKSAGSHYGVIPSADGPIHFGISPFPPGMPSRPGGSGMGIVFRVANYESYLNMLKSRGLVPVAETEDEEGRFAAFLDPDGNGISIWGR